MQTHIDEIRSAGAEVIAVSPDPPQWNRKVGDTLGNGFSICQDEGLRVATAYGVRDNDAVHPVPYGIPRPATFLIDREGIVRWRHLTRNWRVRPRPNTLLEELRRIP